MAGSNMSRAALVSLLAVCLWAGSAFALELVPVKPGGGIKIVFISEAYSASEKDLFLKDVDLGWKAIFSYSPFKEKENQFSVFYTWRPSAVLENQDLYGAGTDSILGSFFPNDPAAFGILLIKDDRVSGLGGNPAIVGTGRLYIKDEFSDFYFKTYLKGVAHEFGHSFGDLGDESDGLRLLPTGMSEKDWDDEFEPLPANITMETRRDFIRWKDLIDPSTPVPTPETPEYLGKIGLFDGAYYYQRGQGWYRSSIICVMGRAQLPWVPYTWIDSTQFCAVCQDQIKKRIQWVQHNFTLKVPLDTLSVERTRETTLTISLFREPDFPRKKAEVVLRSPGWRSFQMYDCDTLLASETAIKMTLRGDDFIVGTHEVVAQVKSYGIFRSKSFWVKVLPEPIPPPNLMVSLPILGSLMVGEESVSMFAMVNSGGIPMVVTGVKFASGRDFTMVEPEFPATIGAYKPMDLSLKFSPTTDGSVSDFLEITYHYADTTVTVSAKVEGVGKKPTPDFINDGVVDITDFFMFADVFGRRRTPQIARFDLDGDGEIGLNDFFIFANAFGTRIPRQ